MFDFLGDMARGAGKILGTAIGSIAGISSVIIANTLGITEQMVDQARESGCETYEDIKQFFKL